MQNPRTPGPVPPHAGLSSQDPDEGLAATLRTSEGKGDARPVAVLLARHWQPAFDYATICTPSAKAAAMLATAACSKLLENLRQARTTAALRPLLLVTARQIGKAWAVDERITALSELQNPDTGRSVPVDMFTIPENRALVARAFQAMPGPAQCLLWHAEVEAEGISVPAGLLAIDPRSAASQLEQARDIFRAGCLRGHLETAPDQDCRHYSRLLDVSLRRGGTLIPDIQTHLAKCKHCRFAAEQLNHVDGRLALLLAEGVLGRAAQPYLDSRPARNNARSQARAAGVRNAVRGAGRHSRGGRPRALPRINFPGRPFQSRGPSLPQRGRGAVITGLGIVTGLLVVATVVIALWPDDGSHAGPVAPSGSVTAMPGPGSRAPSSPGPEPSTTTAGLPTGPLSTRLRNVATGLCLDIRDRRAQLGAEVAMADCSTSVTQEWVYENDGLLRSAAAVDLCLNSHALDGVTVLGPCTDSSAVNASDVRYDLTIQGDVIPRWNDDLAVVPASAEIGSRVVVKVRDGSMAQRWATDNVASVFPKIRPSADTGRPATKEVNVMPTSAVSSRPPEESGGTPEPRDDGPYGQDPYGDDRNGDDPYGDDPYGQDRRPDTRRVGDDRSGADDGSDGSDGPPEEPALRLRPADAADRLPAGRDLPSPAMLRRAGETDRAEG
ncbi:RICIN domain-containing protein [Streptomyces sp. NPDC023998]|uniref:RICIN domain-containing protein n=1 Tax=Streptomyces sp. NPDC023998 TaxID=3154597 RepID=UPI0033F1E207